MNATPADATVAAPAIAAHRVYTTLANPQPKAIVVHCSDPRLQPAFEQFIQGELNLQPGDYIPIVVGGGAGVLGHPTQLPKEFKFLKDRFEHYRDIFPGVRRVVLINHEGCRYYDNVKVRALALVGTRLALAPDHARKDLSLVADAFQHLLAHFGYSIEMYYARFLDTDRTKVVFEKVG